MSHAVILIGTPESWSDTMVKTLVDRLISDALPESVSVAIADADQVEVPFTSTLVRALTEDGLP